MERCKGNGRVSVLCVGNITYILILCQGLMSGINWHHLVLGEGC